jgi:DNA-binding CsgD family transcriptional regulator
LGGLTTATFQPRVEPDRPIFWLTPAPASEFALPQDVLGGMYVWGSSMHDPSRCIGDLLSAPQWESAVRKLRLSARQAQVTRAVLMNLTVRDAAKQLGLRPDTVKTYLKRCYQRLDVNSRLQLAMRVVGAAVQNDSVAMPGDTRAGGLRPQLRHH